MHERVGGRRPSASLRCVCEFMSATPIQVCACAMVTFECSLFVGVTVSTTTTQHIHIYFRYCYQHPSVRTKKPYTSCINSYSQGVSGRLVGVCAHRPTRQTPRCSYQLQSLHLFVILIDQHVMISSINLTVLSLRLCLVIWNMWWCFP